MGLSKEGSCVNRPDFTSGAIRVPGKGGKDCAIPDDLWKECEMTRVRRIGYAEVDRGGVPYLEGQSWGCSSGCHVVDVVGNLG